jgi:hypothetical protein
LAQPTFNPLPVDQNPTGPVVVVINIPVQGVPAPTPDDTESTVSKTEATEQGSLVDVTDTESDILDQLDTPNPTDPSSAYLRPSFANTPEPTSTSTQAETSSTAPSYESGDKFVDAIQESIDNSSGFNARYSLPVRMVITMMAILLVTLFIPNQEGANHHLLFGFGKVLVAAVVVSSLFTRRDKNANVRNASPHKSVRNLQDTCTYNVEILYDGCTKNVKIDAPSARVIDVALKNFTAETNPDDQCQTDYYGVLTFDASNSTEVDLQINDTVSAYSYSDWQCLRAIEGRPFLDATGKSIQALPMVAEVCLDEFKVAGDVSVCSSKSVSNSTNQIMLGNEWTQRALGEHASVASFSAFSIALMTNAAPSSLVEDSLKAGLDEICHAQVSFEIASKLLGKDVDPSSLPESKHEFGQDLTALALAVAREGCVDETLSAIAAAFTVDEISKLLEGEDINSKYAGITHDLLHWIGEELKNITLDESNHSALAWRTLKWVCSIDSDACSAVEREVFDTAKMNMRFNQRSEGGSLLATFMKIEWETIYTAFKTGSGGLDKEISSDKPFVTEVTERVIHAIV